MYNLDQFTHKLTLKSFGLVFVCEWIGPSYTSINSGKNAFIPIINSCLCISSVSGDTCFVFINNIYPHVL
jgi:hypothetical protein